MFAFLKTIFGSRTAAPQQAAGLAMPRTVYTAEARPAPARRPAPAATPRAQRKPATAAPRPLPAVAAPEADVSYGSDVDIPLSSVLRGLPPDLKERVRDLDIRGATMTISLERILAQLPSGSVRISFGSLRQAAPQLFSIGADSDGRDVALPLDEILSRINPAIICPPQHQVARGPIEDEQVFSSDIFTPAAPVQNPRSSTLSVPPAPAPSEVVDVPSTPSARNAQPSRPASKSEVDEIPDLFFDGRKGKAPETNGEHDEAGPRPRVVPAKAAAPPVAASPAPQPKQAEAAVAVQPVQDAAVMRIPLKGLTQLWPEELRSELASLEPAHIVALPAEAINAALKQGKVIFPWATLRSWITPELPSVTFRNDNAALELPLPVIMPVFLAGRKQPSRQQSVAVDDDIPDPFAEFMAPAPAAQKNEKPESEPVRAEKAGKKRPASASKTTDTKSVGSEKVPDTKLFARNQTPATPKTEAKVEPQAEPAPASPKQSSTPAEVLANAIKLDGVAGALVALADGFKVASKLPPGLDGDAVAAFLPHIFSKVNQSTRELRMGELDNLNFTVDNIPWKIFRVNQIFFAALGHAGQKMPTDKLALLAHQLTFKN